MPENIKLGFEFARDLSNQLITLSIGILAFTVTFHKEFVKNIRPGCAWMLVSAWFIHLIAVLFGIVATMALTGALLQEKIPKDHPIGAGPRIMAGIQIIAFLVGTCLMIVYGIRMMPEIRMNLSSRSSDDPRSREAD